MLKLYPFQETTIKKEAEGPADESAKGAASKERGVDANTVDASADDAAPTEIASTAASVSMATAASTAAPTSVSALPSTASAAFAVGPEEIGEKEAEVEKNYSMGGVDIQRKLALYECVTCGQVRDSCVLRGCVWLLLSF